MIMTVKLMMMINHCDVNAWQHTSVISYELNVWQAPTLIIYIESSLALQITVRVSSIICKYLLLEVAMTKNEQNFTFTIVSISAIYER